MAERVKIESIGSVIERELGAYNRGIVEGIDQASEKAAKDLAKRAKAAAPVGYRGKYAKSFASRLLRKSTRGSTYVVFNRGKEYRLTHLLVHGHATRNGGRTRADPFLHNAVAETLTDYERDVKEVLARGK